MACFQKLLGDNLRLMALAVPSASWFLVPIAGPPLGQLELTGKPGGIVLGRHERCDLQLPTDAEKVSRYHARFTYDGSRWHVTDLGSRWGTFVNGVRAAPQSDVRLNDGDILRITPWTFTLSSKRVQRGLHVDDDSRQTQVRTVAQDLARPLAEELLGLLLEYASATHSAADEIQLAEFLLDVAIKGTRLPNAVLLRPLDSAGNFDVIASRAASQGAGAGFSRTLIAAAANGDVVEIQDAFTGDISQSIVQLKITSAICVPLMVSGSVVAYLYLDARGTDGRAIRPGSGAFCVALGRMASLALTNFKRLEMEKREAEMRAELAAAAAAQKWILPPREARFGAFSTIGESRPGQVLGGDFFDIIPLDEHRLAVALGDVSGKGIPASVLMTATQGFLHAILTQGADPLNAVLQLNRFIIPRRPDERFVTLWVGIFDSIAGTLKYVDCGHGYAILQRPDGTFQQLNVNGGPPVGVDPKPCCEMQTVKIAGGDRVVLVSDGIIEQRSGADIESRRQFSLAGLHDALSRTGPDQVADIFAAVIRHAGTERLSDDATAALIRWDSAAVV